MAAMQTLAADTDNGRPWNNLEKLLLAECIVYHKSQNKCTNMDNGQGQHNVHADSRSRDRDPALWKSVSRELVRRRLVLRESNNCLRDKEFFSVKNCQLEYTRLLGRNSGKKLSLFVMRFNQ